MASATYHSNRYQHVWPRWPLLAFFTVLFFGPIIAPLFQATQLWLVADSGALARDLLSHYVCPTPAKSYVLLGYPMAVCARCWGATVGLWMAWFAVSHAMLRERSHNSSFLNRVLQPVNSAVRQYLMLSWPLRFAIAALPFLLWVAEIRGWHGAPLWLLLLNGASAGCGAGLLFCSLWPGLLPRHTQSTVL